MQKMMVLGLACLTVGLLPTSNHAQTTPPSPEAQTPFTERTEKLSYSVKKGSNFFDPILAFGEYQVVKGWVSTSTQSDNSFFGSKGYNKESFKTDYQIILPSADPKTAQSIKVTCAGGRSDTKSGWIKYERDDLDYVCVFDDKAPAGTSFVIALPKYKAKGIGDRLNMVGDLAKQVYGNGLKRAAEFHYKGAEYHAEPRNIRNFMFGGPVYGYVITKDGLEIGGVDFTTGYPTLYVPKTPGDDRDATFIMAINLNSFPDPDRAK